MSYTADSFVNVDISRYLNNDGISYAHNRTDGSFNVWGNTFPAECLPPSLSIVEIGGVPFRFPNKEDGQFNNISCSSQNIPISPNFYDWIYILAAAERRSEDYVYLYYANRHVASEWLRVSDFWPETPAWFGELEAFRCSSMHYPCHTQSNMQPVIWQQRIPVPAREELVQISLPDNVAIHIFAMTLCRSSWKGK